MLSFTFGSEKIPPPSPAAVKLRGEPAEKAPSGLLRLFSRKTQNRQATRTGSPEPELDGSEENTAAAHPPAQQFTRSGTPDWVVAMGSESAMGIESSTEPPAITSRAYPLAPSVATSALGNESSNEPPPPTGGEEGDAGMCIGTTDESLEECKRVQEEMRQLFRVIVSPVTLPMWVLYQTGSVTLTVLSRICLTIHSVAFEADPGKFERILMHNVHFMDGSMRQMNGSLTAAISTIDRQMGDINRLESMWQKEHEAFLAAVEEKKLVETEFQETAHRFREELAAAKKAAVSVCAGSPIVGGGTVRRNLCV